VADTTVTKIDRSGFQRRDAPPDAPRVLVSTFSENRGAVLGLVILPRSWSSSRSSRPLVAPAFAVRSSIRDFGAASARLGRKAATRRLSARHRRLSAATCSPVSSMVRSYLALRRRLRDDALSLTGGILVGVIAGYYRGWIDTVIMRLMDIILAFPSLLLALVLVAMLGPSLTNGDDCDRAHPAAAFRSPDPRRRDDREVARLCDRREGSPAPAR
jgi:hypothetical protein